MHTKGCKTKVWKWCPCSWLSKKKGKEKKLLLTNLTSITLKETDSVCPKCYPHYTCWNQHYFPFQCLIYNNQHLQDTFIAYTFSKIFLFRSNLLLSVTYDLILCILFAGISNILICQIIYQKRQKMIQKVSC